MILVLAGACTAVCPDVFDPNDEGKAFNTLGEDVSADLMDSAKEAAESCPEAIEL